jgi:hypothetical protein
MVYWYTGNLVYWYTGNLVDWWDTNLPIHQCTNLPITYRTEENDVEEIRSRLTALRTKLENIRGRL